MGGAIAGIAGTILGPVVGPVVSSIAGSVGQVLGGGAAGPLGGAANPLGGLLGSIGSAFGDLFGAKKPGPPPMCCTVPPSFSLPPGFPIGNSMGQLQKIMGQLQAILPGLQNVLKQFGGGGSTFPSLPGFGGVGGFAPPPAGGSSINAQAISMGARGDALSKDAMAILGDPNASFEQKIAAQQKLADAFQMMELASTISKKASDIEGKIIGNLV